MRDLTGQRFGRLVALEPTNKRVDQLVVWRCRCDCGRECEVVGRLLTKGATRSCGCLARDVRSRDLAGQRFGKLVAIEPTDERERGQIVWHCRCDCGGERNVASGMLRSGQVRSCGCMPRGKAVRDLAGQRFGRLVAVRPVGRKRGSILWECACDCGGTKIAPSSYLVQGKVKSCGCLRAERSRAAREAVEAAAARPDPNLTCCRFGSLISVDRTGARRAGSPVWRCLCDCDRVVEASADELTSGTFTSCGECGADGDNGSSQTP